MPDITKIAETEMEASIRESLLAGQRYRRKCYENDREGQLIRFGFGYTPDWSHDELLFALKRKITTLRKAAKLYPGMAQVQLLPMVRAAWEVETQSAKQEAA